jgi:hypothetical protein
MLNSNQDYLNYAKSHNNSLFDVKNKAKFFVKNS